MRKVQGELCMSPGSRKHTNVPNCKDLSTYIDTLCNSRGILLKASHLQNHSQRCQQQKLFAKGEPSAENQIDIQRQESYALTTSTLDHNSHTYIKNNNKLSPRKKQRLSGFNCRSETGEPLPRHLEQNKALIRGGEEKIGSAFLPNDNKKEELDQYITLNNCEHRVEKVQRYDDYVEQEKLEYNCGGGKKNTIEKHHSLEGMQSSNMYLNHSSNLQTISKLAGTQILSDANSSHSKKRLNETPFSQDGVKSFQALQRYHSREKIVINNVSKPVIMIKGLVKANSCFPTKHNATSAVTLHALKIPSCVDDELQNNTKIQPIRNTVTVIEITCEKRDHNTSLVRCSKTGNAMSKIIGNFSNQHLSVAFNSTIALVEQLHSSNFKCVVKLSGEFIPGDHITLIWSDYVLNNIDNATRRKSECENNVLLKIPFSVGISTDTRISDTTLSPERFIRVMARSKYPADTIKGVNLRERQTKQTDNSGKILINDESNKIFKSRSVVTWKWDEYQKKCSRIGSIYQVSSSSLPDSGCWDTHFPTSNSNPNKGRTTKKIQQHIPPISPISPISPITKTVEYEQIWDFVKAEKAEKNKENIFAVLSSTPTNQKVIMMEAIHQSQYYMRKAWCIFIHRVQELEAIGALHGIPLSRKSIDIFQSEIFLHRKYLKRVLSRIQQNGDKLSMCSMLVYYYRYFKPSEEYSRLKNLMKDESDTCGICSDGGDLICCDECIEVYHLHCLNLTRVPEGRWYCPKCVNISRSIKSGITKD